MLTASQEELQRDGLPPRILGDVKLEIQLLVLQQRRIGSDDRYACPRHFVWCGREGRETARENQPFVFHVRPRGLETYMCCIPPPLGCPRRSLS